MGTAGTVAFLFLRRRSTQPRSEPGLVPHEVLGVDGPVVAPPAMDSPVATSAPMDGPVVPSAVADVSRPSSPPASLPLTPPLPLADAPQDAPHNGHNPEVAAPSPIQPVTPSSALAPETTTKLVPVNIVDELVQDLQNPDPAQRRKAIWELGQRGNSAAVQPLSRLMLDADSKERSLILAALAEISTQTLKPMNRALALSLQDENPEVRKNAIRDLTRIYDLMGQAGTLLSHAASDSDPEVRQTASWAMDQLNRMRLKAVNTDETPSLQGHNGSSSE
ncbi:MAG: HEAT repeat domain-containing protein [Leptolyngbya sp. RL_3_1]|nr:HEAT repeat domain-containing protein [Leptolyngbya sp. RL_3_1]